MPSKLIRRILVAVKDPIARTSASIFKAAQLAHALNAELVLFHGIDVPLCAEAYEGSERNLGADEESIRSTFLYNLSAQAEAVRQEGISVSVAAEWDYPAPEAILRYGQHIQADLIVTERHPHGAATPWALHSVDWELVRLSTKPILVVKDPTPYLQPVVLAAVDPPLRKSKPTDLDASICALAEIFSTGLNGAWHALHAAAGTGDVVFEHADVVFERTSRPTGNERARNVRRTRALAAMERLFEATPVNPKSLQLLDRSPVQAILEGVQKLHASILVMGDLSRRGLRRVLVGNTAEQVIDSVPCDLLIAKPKRFGIHFSQHVRGPNMLSVATASPNA